MYTNPKPYKQFIFIFIFLGLMNFSLAQQFVNGKLVSTAISGNTYTDGYRHYGSKYRSIFPNGSYDDEIPWFGSLKIEGLDSLKHQYCPEFRIYPNREYYNGPFCIDRSSAVSIPINGDTLADFGFSLKLTKPLQKDSDYTLEFLVSSETWQFRYKFYDKKLFPYEDFKIFVTQSQNAHEEGDTIAVIRRSDVFELDSSQVVPQLAEISRDAILYSLDRFFYVVRKNIRGANSGSYITIKAKVQITDSVSQLFRAKLKPSVYNQLNQICLTRAMIATYFNLKCPFKINKSGYLCSSNQPLALSSSSISKSDKFNWSTGDTTAFVRIKKSGMYWLEKNRDGCKFRDTVYVDSLLTGSSTNTVIDKCKDSALSIGNAVFGQSDYFWNTGAKTPILIVKNSGIYTRYSNLDGCIIHDTFNVSDFPKHNAIDKFRFEICNGDTLMLKCNVNECEWIRKTQVIHTNPNFKYFGNLNDTLMLKSRVNCWQIDTVKIDVKECPKNIEDLIFVPNAFTPNGQGPNTNELFQAQCASCIIIYMRIYNNWGEKIYEGVEPWNGTYQGQIVPNGVYAYTIGVKVTTGSNANIEHFKGSVQVLR